MLETSFRIHRDEVTRTLIGCPPTAERQNSIRSYLLRNGSYVTTAGGNGNGATDFFYVRMEFLRNLCNGNGRTATGRWKLGISRLKSDRGEIWQDCSWSEYALIGEPDFGKDITFSRWRPQAQYKC